jgi:hypothetical protein
LAFAAMRARETAQQIKLVSQMNPSTCGGAAAKDLERMELAYLDYTQTVDAERTDPWTFAQQYGGFSNVLRWKGGRQGLTRNADTLYRGRNAFLLKHQDAVPTAELERIRREESALRPRNTKASVVDRLGFFDDHIERQRESLRAGRTPQSSAGGRAALPPPPSLVFRSTAEEEEEAEFNEETAGANAPRFFVYELEMAATLDELKAAPSRGALARSQARRPDADVGGDRRRIRAQEGPP